jgi:hypothetical protein
MMKEDLQLSQVFCLAVDLGLLLGVKNLKDWPEPWICKIDDHWTLAINGSDEEKDVDLGQDSMGITKLKTFQMAIWFNGWLAGILNPVGGIICAGEAGNEDNLIRALEERISIEKLAKQMTA